MWLRVPQLFPFHTPIALNDFFFHPLHDHFREHQKVTLARPLHAWQRITGSCAQTKTRAHPKRALAATGSKAADFRFHLAWSL